MRPRESLHSKIVSLGPLWVGKRAVFAQLACYNISHGDRASERFLHVRPIFHVGTYFWDESTTEIWTVLSERSAEPDGTMLLVNLNGRRIYRVHKCPGIVMGSWDAKKSASELPRFSLSNLDGSCPYQCILPRNLLCAMRKENAS